MSHTQRFDTRSVIDKKAYNSANASLSRALTRLAKRGLIEFHRGAIWAYGGGITLTASGLKMAERLPGAAG
jgi:Mn-dependent DtxR family transcriptional regulator